MLVLCAPMRDVAVEHSCTLGTWEIALADDHRSLVLGHAGAAWLSGVRFAAGPGAADGDDPAAGPLLRLRPDAHVVVAVAEGRPGELTLTVEDGQLVIHASGAGDARLVADVEGGRHPINARLSEGEEDVDLVGSRAKPYTGEPDAEVQQMASGLGVSRLSDSVYDRYRDAALIVRARDVAFAPREGGFSVAASGPAGERPLCRLEVRERVNGSRLAHWAPLDKDAWPAPPVVWNSFYALGIYEFVADDVVANAEILARELGAYGPLYCMIDGGWQQAKVGGEWIPHNYGHWREANDRFPGGMQVLSRRLREAGVIPALWFSVFASADEQLYAEHREWFIHDAGGNAKLGTWIGDHVVDLSHPQLREHLRELYREVCEEWGYAYLKLDGLAQVREVWRRNRAQAYDPTLSPEAAFRGALAAVREAVPEGTFLSGCRKDLVGTGILHSSRLGTDTVDPGDDETLSFRGVRSALEGMRLDYHLHNVAIYTDPDAFAIRLPLADHEARTWASMMALSGQMITLGDDMTTLPAERVEVIRRILPVADVTPMDLFPIDRERFIWALHVVRPFGGWSVLGLFNWDYAADELVDVVHEDDPLFRALDANDALLGEEHDWGVRWSMATHAAEAAAENERLAALPDKPAGLRYLPISGYAAPPAPRRVEVDFAKSGLDPEQPYALFDFWAQRFLGVVQGAYAAELEPHACQVVSARPFAGRPLLVGTDRHVTMGAVELHDERWDEARAELRLALTLVAGAPMTLTVHPAGRRLAAAQAEGAETTIAHGEETVRVTVTSPQGGLTAVRLQF